MRFQQTIQRIYTENINIAYKFINFIIVSPSVFIFMLNITFQFKIFVYMHK